MDSATPSHSVVSLRDFQERAARLEQRAGIAPAPQVIERIIEKAAASNPPSWRFTVVRGDDNLISEILAEPM